MLPSQVLGSDGWLGNQSGDKMEVVSIRWKNDLGMLHVGPDGELLDKSEITWVYDPDDDRPMPQVMTSLTDQCQLSITTPNSFVTQVPLATC